MKHTDDIRSLDSAGRLALRERIKALPEMHAFIAAVSKEFPGSYVERVVIGDEQWGPDRGVEFEWVPQYQPSPKKKGKR
jgi:hypothetical protein